MDAKYLKCEINRCFGVEVEYGNKINQDAMYSLVYNIDSERDIFIYDHYSQDVNNTAWIIKKDRSCGDIKNEYGIEVSTYKCSSFKDLTNIGNVYDNIGKNGANINERCALHVHVEICDFSLKELENLVLHWIMHENSMMSIAHPSRADSIYSKRLSSDKIIENVNNALKNNESDYIIKNFFPNQKSDENRRRAINLCNFFHMNGKKTVEFRYPESSTDGDTVKNWVRLFVKFVESCKSKNFPKTIYKASLEETVNFLDLTTDLPVYSEGMISLNNWFLSRALSYGKNTLSEKDIEFSKTKLSLISL